MSSGHAYWGIPEVNVTFTNGNPSSETKYLGMFDLLLRIWKTRSSMALGAAETADELVKFKSITIKLSTNDVTFQVKLKRLSIIDYSVSLSLASCSY